MGWISIKDFKPDQRSENSQKNVICYASEYKNIYITQYVNGRFKFEVGTQAYSDVITHWMPLPEPPKE